MAKKAKKKKANMDALAEQSRQRINKAFGLTGLIRNLQDLIDHFGATDAKNLNRRIYKDTACGASISVRPAGRSIWIHNGESAWESVTEIDAFTIQTIVEGSDATVDSDTFVLPVAVKVVDAWIKDMEAEANRLWHEAHDENEDDDDMTTLPEPYEGPATFTIDAQAALKLFTMWHRDEVTSSSGARDYAHRLLTRLHEEAKGK